MTVETAEPTVEHVAEFYRLMRETTERDGFSAGSERYFRELVAALAAENTGEMLFARLGGEVVAVGIFVYYHRAGLYYYGASSGDPEVRRAMPTYLLQWTAIRHAMERGCRTYDFLGIEPESGGDGHLAGVTQFKRRFVPDATTVWPEARIRVVRPAAYALLRLARSLRRLLVR